MHYHCTKSRNHTTIICLLLLSLGREERESLRSAIIVQSSQWLEWVVGEGVLFESQQVCTDCSSPPSAIIIIHSTHLFYKHFSGAICLSTDQSSVRLHSFIEPFFHFLSIWKTNQGKCVNKQLRKLQQRKQMKWEFIKWERYFLTGMCSPKFPNKLLEGTTKLISLWLYGSALISCTSRPAGRWIDWSYWKNNIRGFFLQLEAPISLEFLMLYEEIIKF